MNRTLVAALILIAEVFVAGYVALFAGVMSAWMVDRHEALVMRDVDWVVAGCGRFAGSLILAAAFTLAARVPHRRWVLAALPSLRSVPVVLGSVIAMASAAGATWFIVSRPLV